MARERKSYSTGSDLNMTPMIDVVFQLIIFFVVTLKMTKDENTDIELEDGKHGPIVKEMPPQTLIIEVARNGRISIHNAAMNERMLQEILIGRVNRFRNTSFPVLIRADYRTKHRDVKRVMDVCTSAGIWKLSFVAIQEHKAGGKK
ncbi:MAG: biopolymer transporter ExbD [Lentisphaerae bacterium]|jgi:biopolymer transport protein ExbD|nr:biopolymer transporter ExbD [Lentisphaerota bacterium]